MIQSNSSDTLLLKAFSSEALSNIISSPELLITEKNSTSIENESSPINYSDKFCYFSIFF